MPPWPAFRAAARSESPTVTSLASCSATWRPPSCTSCESIDEWLRAIEDGRAWPDSESSTTSDGEESESDSQSFYCTAAAAASGSRVAVSPTVAIAGACLRSSTYSSSADEEAAAAAALEDALEIDEWFEEQRARDHQSLRRTLSYVPSPTQRASSQRARATARAFSLTHGGRLACDRCGHCLSRLHQRCRELVFCRFGC